LKKYAGVYPIFKPSQGQHDTFGLQFGFSQTSSHLGLGHSGLEHFQSHLGSSHTASHSGLGAWQWVTQCGYLHIVTHLGQSSASHALSGHLIYHLENNFAIRLFAFYITNRVFRLLTTSMTFRGFTNWVTQSRALWIVTFPSALGVTVRVSIFLFFKWINWWYNKKDYYAFHLIFNIIIIVCSKSSI